MLGVVTFLPFRLGLVDISGAYMQSGPIRRSIYVRPPREWHNTERGHVWQLLKLPYGITEAGRQWATVIEGWLTDDMGMERVQSVSQLFVKRDGKEGVTFLLAKVTDDLLFAGSIEYMQEFIECIQKRFDVSKSFIDGPILFNGCRIEQDGDGTITMSMKKYLESVIPLDVSRVRRKQAQEKAKRKEYDSYRSLAGSIIWQGNGTLPQAAFTGSYMQQTARDSAFTTSQKLIQC